MPSQPYHTAHGDVLPVFVAHVTPYLSDPVACCMTAME